MFDEQNYLNAFAKQQNQPMEAEFTYVQKPTKKMNIPYSLTVKGYKYLFLNSIELEELSPKEQLILINSTDDDVTKSPELTIAAIYVARQFSKRTDDNVEAYNRCIKCLTKQSHDILQAHKNNSKIRKKLSQYEKKLRKSLSIRQEMKKYKRKQNSFFSPIINLKNKILHIFNKNIDVNQPYTDSEFDKAEKMWDEFRTSNTPPAILLDAFKNPDKKAPKRINTNQNSPEKICNMIWNEFKKVRKNYQEVSDEELLIVFKYGSEVVNSDAFSYLMDDEDITALDEEYHIYNIASNILNGSAYENARKKFTPKATFKSLKSDVKPKEKEER